MFFPRPLKKRKKVARFDIGNGIIRPYLEVFSAYEASVDVDVRERDRAALLKVKVEDVPVDGVEVGALGAALHVLVGPLGQAGGQRSRVVVLVAQLLLLEGALQVRRHFQRLQRRVAKRFSIFNSR